MYGLTPKRMVEERLGTVRALDSRLRALRSTRELAQYSDAQLRSLLPYVDEVAVPAGCQVALEGHVCNQFLIVMEGRLCATSDRGGCQHLVAGDSCGWAAMCDRTVNDATVVVESDARLLVMGHAQFRAVKFVGRHFLAGPGAGRRILEKLRRASPVAQIVVERARAGGRQ